MRRKINNKSFEGQTIYTGIDVHKKSWKVTLRNEHHHLKTFSQDPSPEVLMKHLHQNYPGANYKALYEAGFSGFGACRKFIEKGVDCKIVHPMDIPRSNKDRQMKTDTVDSRKLCSLHFDVNQQYIHIPDEELEADRALLRQRYRVMKDLARTKNRLKSIFFQLGIKVPKEYEGSASRNWSKAYLNWIAGIELYEVSARWTIDRYISIGKLLATQLRECNKAVLRISTKERYNEDFRLLLTIPGVGRLTAMVLLLQIGDINRFKTLDKLCFYVGLVPRTYSSGESQKTGKLIKRGRREIKIHLIESSWVAVRKDPALTSKFVELSRTMNKNKAIIRIARKLLSRIRYILKNKKPYQIGIVQ
jgi:transposase